MIGMQLSDLLQGLTYERIKGTLERTVSHIAYDSREVQAGSLFVAITGFTVDGHRYIPDAIRRGAEVILIEQPVAIADDVTVLQVQDTRYALARLAANFYNRPTDMLNLIGVTGTNGKTSITYFVKSIFEQAHRSVGVIGTIGTLIGGQLRKNKNPTTPEALELQQIFHEMADAGIMNCVMEVSSHALSLDRVACSRFRTAIFTNLTPDHLELHRSMDEYYVAKARLFKMAEDYNIVNIDDPYGRRLCEEAANFPARLITYGIEQPADVYATEIELTADYTTYTAHTPAGSFPVKVQLPGLIYVYNSLAAIACAYANGIDPGDIQQGIEAVQGIQGRMEVVYQTDDYKVVVDFAHTEDSLEKAITTLKPFTKGRLIVVFGVYAAPGELGLSKRRGMGKVAARLADLSVVTSDNPKEQDPKAIIADVAAAIEEEGGRYTAIVDRREAIRHAVEICRPGDVILIAGKGHERTQVIGKEEIPFHEAEIVREAFQELGKE